MKGTSKTTTNGKSNQGSLLVSVIFSNGISCSTIVYTVNWCLIGYCKARLTSGTNMPFMDIDSSTLIYNYLPILSKDCNPIGTQWAVTSRRLYRLLVVYIYAELLRQKKRKQISLSAYRNVSKRADTIPFHLCSTSSAWYYQGNCSADLPVFLSSSGKHWS